jgi:hypothetical protein
MKERKRVGGRKEGRKKVYHGWMTHNNKPQKKILKRKNKEKTKEKED